MMQSFIKLWKLLLIIPVLILSTNFIPHPASAQTLAVKIEPGKPFFGLTEKITVNIVINNESDNWISSVRIVFRLKNEAGKIISYKNLYPGALRPGESRFSVSVDAARLEVSEGIYPCEVIVFERTDQIAEKHGFIVFADSVSPLKLVPTLELKAPFRVHSNGVFEGEDILSMAVSGSRENQYLDMMIANELPGIIVLTSGLIYQLEKMSKGYKAKVGTKTVKRSSDSEQARLAKTFLEKIRAAASKEAVSVAFTPYAEINPKDCIKMGLQERLRQNIIKGQEYIKNVLSLKLPPSLIFIPHGGIDSSSLQMLSDMGFSVLIRSPSSTSTSFLTENTSVYCLTLLPQHEELTGQNAASHIYKNLTKDQITEKRERIVAFVLNPIDPSVLSFLRRDFASSTHLSFVHLNRFNLSPMDAPNFESEYGKFKDLAFRLLKRYSEVSKLFYAYESSLLQEKEFKQQLLEKVSTGLMSAFNEKPDYNIAFSQLSLVADLINKDFKSISIEGKTINFPHASGKLPITLVNKSKRVFKVIVKLKSDDIDFKRKEISLIASPEDSIFTVPVKVKKSGNIDVIVEVFTPNGHLINKDMIKIRSTYASRLLSLLSLIILLILGLFFLRSKLKPKKE